MSITQTELWKNSTFTIERIEGHAPHALIYRITGPFNARDMYGSMKQVALGNIFDFKPAAGVKLPAQQLKEDNTIVTLGTVKFFMIHRGDKFAIRVKDSDAKARKEFAGLKWYPPDPSWRRPGTRR